MDMSSSSLQVRSAASGPRGRTSARPEWLIDTWLELLPARQAATLSILHRAVLAASPALQASLKWGNLVYMREGRAIAQLTPYRPAVHLQLVQPREPRQAPPRRGKGGLVPMRFVHGQEIDPQAVTWMVVNVLRFIGR